MNLQIEIKMKGIYGTLYYSTENESYEIPIENTGDYRDGYLLLLKELDSQIASDELLQKKSEVRRVLQAWGKENDYRFCW